MSGGHSWKRAAFGLAAAALLAVPGSAAAQDAAAGEDAQVVAGAGTGPEPARLELRLKGAHGGDVHVGNRVRAIGRLRPFVPGQHVVIWLRRDGQTIKRKTPLVEQIGDRNVGRFHIESSALIKPGPYRVRAVHKWTPEQEFDADASPRFHVSYPDLDPGDRNDDVRLFTRLLDQRGYHVPVTSAYGSAVERAVMAFRKVNRMERSWNASPTIFRTLAAGHGGFGLAYPGAGRHVEVDISRQVMVLADDGKARHIFHVSTGAPSTPTIRGHYQFYMRDPGYNSKGMYYSVYFKGGYATHGYASVPPYPASHGCVRNPIPNSVFIYNWVRLGMSIYLYD